MIQIIHPTELKTSGLTWIDFHHYPKLQLLIMSTYTSERWSLTVTENGDNTFTIEWDENDLLTAKLNTWTEEDFMLAITQGIEDELLMLVEEECAKN